MLKIFKLWYLTKSQWKYSDRRYPQLFISITDFDTEETDDSHILVTLLDSMGQPEETKRFDRTNYDVEKWVQDGYLTNTNTCTTLGANGVSNAISILWIQNRKIMLFKIDHARQKNERISTFLKNQLCPWVRSHDSWVVTQFWKLGFMTLRFSLLNMAVLLLWPLIRIENKKMH